MKTRAHVVVAALAGLLAVPATYALLRGYDVMFRHEANPATVIFSAKIAMFWRLGIGGYVGGMIAFAVFFLARRDLHRTVRGLSFAATVVAAMVVIQGLFLP